MEQGEAIKDVAPLKPGQTVCNRRDEKGKLCAGPLKRRPDPTYRSKTELAGSDVIFRCGRCYALYSGPPSGFLHDASMSTFVMKVQPDIKPPEPKEEKPKEEKPKVETPKVETPKVETPKEEKS